MLAKILSGAVVGLDAVPVTVEVDIAAQGLPSFTIVGLADKAVDESRERVRSALKNSGAEFPAKRITVNLAPADLPKIGPAYDLPIALGILIASEQLPQLTIKSLFFGELSLDGSLRHTNGILPLALLAKTEQIKDIYLPEIDAKEAAVLQDLSIFPVLSLLSLFRHLSGIEPIAAHPHINFSEIVTESGFEFDMADIQGQEQAKRAFEIAAAGGHNLFMQGPPGAGKTLLARTLPSILPVLTENEAIEVTKIYSVTGNLPVGQSIIKYRPFRAPHHTTSRIGLIGGGAHPMPGEISLSNRGVLFLDEFPEFPRHVLEALRQPMEDGIVNISRASGTVCYPAKFVLVAAANPCPCGNFGSLAKHCTCMPGVVSKYQKKISGPIIDRIDLHLQVGAVDVDKLIINVNNSNNLKSVDIRKQVQRARDKQTERLSSHGLFSNAEMNSRQVREFCPLNTEEFSFLKQAIVRFGLSARSYYKVIKIARTIADLAEAEQISVSHLAEALQYRPKD